MSSKTHYQLKLQLIRLASIINLNIHLRAEDPASLQGPLIKPLLEMLQSAGASSGSHKLSRQFWKTCDALNPVWHWYKSQEKVKAKLFKWLNCSSPLLKRDRVESDFSLAFGSSSQSHSTELWQNPVPIQEQCEIWCHSCTKQEARACPPRTNVPSRPWRWHKRDKTW